MAIQFEPKGLTKTGPSVVERLAELRRQFEADGAPLHTVTGNLAVFLDDVARALGLSGPARAAVLGQEAAKHVEEVANTPVKLNGKGGHLRGSRPTRG